MTKIFRRSKFISFVLVLAVVFSATAFAFADEVELPSMGTWYSLDRLTQNFIVSNENLTYTFINPSPYQSGSLSYIWTGIQIGYHIPDTYDIDYSTSHALTLKYELDLSQYNAAVYLCNRQVNEASFYPNFPSSRKFDTSKVVDYENCDLLDNQIVAIDPTKPVYLTIYEPNFSATKLAVGQYDLRYPFGFGTKALGNGSTFTARLIGLEYGGYNYTAMPSVIPNYYTYKFNVPSGQMLHIIADDIQEVTLKYNVGFGLFRPSTQTLNANRYSYKVDDYANLSAFSDSNLVNWTKGDSSTYNCTIEHDNSNALNFYNFNLNAEEKANNYEVYITCSIAKAYMYSQNWKGQVIESTSSSGALFLGGGNGTTESPYNVQLYDTENSTLYKPSTLEVDTTSQDSAMNTIVNTLTAPSRFIGVITESTGNFMQTISTMFSWLPVELTSVIVGAFSVIIAVGVLKMFL